MIRIIKTLAAMISSTVNSTRTSIETTAFDRGMPSPEIRFSKVAKNFDSELQRLFEPFAEMLKIKSEVQEKTAAYLAGINTGTRPDLAKALDLAEDKLVSAVFYNTRRLAELRDRFASLTAEQAYQNLNFKKYCAGPNSLSLATAQEMLRHKNAFEVIYLTLRQATEIELTVEMHTVEHLGLLNARAAMRKSGISYQVHFANSAASQFDRLRQELNDKKNQEDTTAAYRQSMDLNAHMCSW